MIWAICNDLDINYYDAVVLYQSNFFKDEFPEENKDFKNVIYVDEVAGDLKASLLTMREQMLSRKDLLAAVFIGGMDGVEKEYELFKKFHPKAKVLPVPSTGGASLQLAKSLNNFDEKSLNDVDYAKLFRSELSNIKLQ